MRILLDPLSGKSGAPQDGLEWDAVDWRVHEKNVARLRQRIFTAAREQDWAHPVSGALVARQRRSPALQPATSPGLA
ncbi:MAG: reverse transcriptase N-terminal domain-containing protein [Streptosporangiaceae bacterium]